jgi:hypothetical protein
MPVVRFIHPPDVRQYGDGPVVVEDVQARVLTEMRRAVLLTEDDLGELKKAELLEAADSLNVEASAGDTKAEIVEAITKPKGR